MVIVTVKSGDTVDSIAQSYGVTSESIIAANRLTDPSQLVVGQTLVIVFPEPSPKYGTFSVNGYAYPFISREILSESLPYLTYLTVFTYGFTEDGSLIEPDDTSLVADAAAGGADVVMLISTLTDEGTFSNQLSNYLLENRSLWDTLIDNIIINMRAKGYTGLDIDFEYVFASDAAAYARFVAYTTQRLNNEGYFVIVALAPKTSADQPGLLYEGHDYGALGAAANYVLLMTYEWGYTYSAPMAVAPINRVRDVLNFAVTQIPRSKIFMGMPNYGYDWPLPYVRGETMARSLGNVEAVDIAGENGAEIFFDTTAQAPYFNYTDASGVAHEVWFEDARSVAAKLSLAQEYGLWGVSFWNLMRSFPQGWLVLSESYNIRSE